MHDCDPAVDPRGGLLTLARVVGAIISAMNQEPPTVIADIDGCQRCRNLFTLTLAGLIAGLYNHVNPESRMGLELQLAAVHAAIDRGEVETPPDGFI